MKHYFSPEIEIIKLRVADVIATSGGGNSDWSGEVEDPDLS